ncbi:MAG: HAMP domain-containing protein, partial [Bacteroidales bacterium]|nr:HAMP domain-containing protein [Bacteroidales bacterium]
MKINIRSKILLYMLVTTIVFYLMVVGYLLRTLWTNSYNDALIKIEQEAETIAKSVGIEFENKLSTARTLSQAFTIYKTMPEEEWTRLFISMYTPILERTPQIFYIWDSWEYNKYKPNYTKTHGRLVTNLRRENGKIVSDVLERDTDSEGVLYSGLKKLNHETIMDPYIDEGPASEKIMVVSYIAPIQINDEFCGLVGLDADMGNLQDLIVKANTIKGGYATLVSHGGIIAGHPKTALIGKHINDVIPKESETHRLQEKIEQGRALHYVRQDANDSYVVYWCPVNTIDQVAPWSVGVVVPYDSIFSGLHRTLLIGALISLLGLLLITGGALFVSNNISRPIAQMTQRLNRLADGEMSQEQSQELRTGDELEEMSRALDTSLRSLNSKAQFAEAIGNG